MNDLEFATCVGRLHAYFGKPNPSPAQLSLWLPKVAHIPAGKVLDWVEHALCVEHPSLPFNLPKALRDLCDRCRAENPQWFEAPSAPSAPSAPTNPCPNRCRYGYIHIDAPIGASRLMPCARCQPFAPGAGSRADALRYGPCPAYDPTPRAGKSMPPAAKGMPAAAGGVGEATGTSALASDVFQRLASRTPPGSDAVPAPRP